MKKFFKNNFLLIVASIFVLILFSLRFFSLTLLPVFADEAIYVRWSQVMKAEETLRFLPLSDGKQPLFMWATIPFLKIFQNPLFAARLLSVISGLMTLIGVSFVSYLLFKSRKVAIIAGLIYAISPFIFFFNRMALADSMLAMFGIWTFIFSFLMVKTERLDFAMLAGFALGGAWLTKSPALFFALLLPTFWIFAKSFRSMFKVIPLTLITITIGYGMYNILRLGPNYHMIASRNLDYVYPLNHFLTSPFDPLKPFILQAWEWIVMMGPWTLIPLWLLSYTINWKKTWKQKLVLTAFFLLPIIVQSEFAKVFTARYILFTIPYLIILAASSFSPVKNFKYITHGVLILFVIQALNFDYNLLFATEKANLPRSERSGYLEEWTAGQGIKEISDYIKNEELLSPDQKIVVGTEGYFGTLPDGVQIYLNKNPKIIVIGTGLDFKNVPQSLLDSKKAGNKTYLIVNSDRYNGNSEESGLKLISSYPKAQRPDETRQSLLFFEVTEASLTSSSKQ